LLECDWTGHKKGNFEPAAWSYSKSSVRQDGIWQTEGFPVRFWTSKISGGHFQDTRIQGQYSLAHGHQWLTISTTLVNALLLEGPWNDKWNGQWQPQADRVAVFRPALVALSRE